MGVVTTHNYIYPHACWGLHPKGEVILMTWPRDLGYIDTLLTLQAMLHSVLFNHATNLPSIIQVLNSAWFIYVKVLNVISLSRTLAEALLDTPSSKARVDLLIRDHTSIGRLTQMGSHIYWPICSYNLSYRRRQIVRNSTCMVEPSI